MESNRKKEFLLNAAYYGILILGFYLFCAYLLSPMLPFLLGFLVAWLLRRPSVLLSQKLHIPGKLGGILLAILFFLLLLALCLLVGGQMLSLLMDALPKLPGLVTGQVLPALESWSNSLEQWLGQFSPDLSIAVEQLYEQISASAGTWVSNFATTALHIVSQTALNLPNWILRLVLTVISTFFITWDMERIVPFLRRHCPARLRVLLRMFQAQTLRSLGIYLRSYTLILGMTFIELAVGFLLLRIPYAVPLALAIAVMDILPVVGTGLVLLPWGVIALVLSFYGMGIGILVLYVAITVIRNIVEPRLVGKQIGLHPLVTLMSMFVGLQLFGFWGLFGLPILLSVLVQLDWSQFKAGITQKASAGEGEP